MMDPGCRTPLIDLFRRGEADRSIRMLAARGAIATRAVEQLAILLLLTADEDPEVARQAELTIGTLPAAALTAFLARADTPEEMRAFFAARGVVPAGEPAEDSSEPLLDADAGGGDDGEEESDAPRVLSTLPIIERIKLAVKGTREQRAQLVRDSNRMVATAVLSSPKLNESEVEAFAKMANVSDEVLRIIGTNRTWLKNYAIVLGLTRNPKTPPGISMQLLHRLSERDQKAVSTDRNVPEALRLAARRQVVKGQK